MMEVNGKISSALQKSGAKCCAVVSSVETLRYCQSHGQHRPLPQQSCISSPSPRNCACGQLLCPVPVPVSESSPCHRPEQQPGWSAFPPAHGSLCSREKKQQVLRGLRPVNKLFHLVLRTFNMTSKSFRVLVIQITFIIMMA